MKKVGAFLSLCAHNQSASVALSVNCFIIVLNRCHDPVTLFDCLWREFGHREVMLMSTETLTYQLSTGTRMLGHIYMFTLKLTTLRI